MSKAEENASQFYVIERILYILSIAIEISSESEPEDLEEVDELNDIKHEEDNLNDLDNMMAAVKSTLNKYKYKIKNLHQNHNL